MTPGRPQGRPGVLLFSCFLFLLSDMPAILGKSIGSPSAADPRKPRRAARKGTPGFALVATMTCMVLLMVLATGMMSLSAITVRKTGRDSARLEAEANARMALMFAIAEIQEQLGPDQRVSGDARLAAQGKGTPANPNWVSVWSTTQKDGEPWIRRDGEKGGLGDLRGDRRDPRSERLAVLVSGNERSIIHEDTEELDEKESVVLVGDRSIGSDMEKTDKVRVPLVALNDKDRRRGRYAWWVGDLGTKANIATRDVSSENSSSSNLALMLAQDASWQAFGKKEIPPESRGGLVSDRQVELVDNNLKDRNFHDYTVWSAGLPINVRDGGWKRDLTAYLASDGNVPDYRGGGANLPGLDDNDRMVGSANDRVDGDSWDPGQSSRVSPVAPKYGLLRKWAERAEIASPSGYSAGTETGDTSSSSTPQGELSVGNSKKVVDFRGQTQSKLMPVLAEGSIYYNLSYYNVTDPTGKNPCGLRVHYYPRVVLWNPYNFPLNVPASAILLFVNGSKTVEVTLPEGIKRQYRMNWGGGGASRGSLYFRMNAATLPPGESMVWSPASNRVYNETAFGQNLLSPTVAPSPSRSFYQDSRVLDDKPLFELQNAPANSGLKHNRTSAPPIDWREVVPPTSSGNLQAAMYTQADDYLMSWKPLSASSFNMTTFGDFPMGRFVSCAYQYGDEDEMPVEWTSLDPVPFTLSAATGVVSMVPDRRTRDGFRFRWSQETESNLIGSGNLAGTAHLEDSAIGNWNVRASYSLRNPFDNVTDVAPNFFGIYTRDLFDGEVDWNNMNPRAQDGKFLGDPFEQPIRAPQKRILFDVPRKGAEIASLGAFQHATLSEMIWHPTYVLGNSLADPRVPQDHTEPDRSKPINRDKGGWNQDSIGFSTADGRSNTNGENATTNEDNWAYHARRLMQNAAFENTLIYDLSYEVNHTLWDTHFLSSGTPRQKQAFLGDYMKNPLPNGRMIPNLMGGKIEEDELNDYHRAASRLLVDGAFNVNSTSVEAWESLLLSNLGTKYNDKVAFPRFLEPEGGMWNGADASSTGAWSGQRVFDKDEIRKLAEQIVRQVEERGPFLSMADFVNRRLSLDEYGKKGALQAAIDNAGLNQAFVDKWPLDNSRALPDYDHPDHIRDATSMEQTSKPDTSAWGALGFLTQADLLQFLGPALTVRSDTFKVRAYGESVDKSGKVMARAWCEAVVQRTPGYVDPKDSMMMLPKDLNETNRKFGRRFQQISFRWLKPDEI